jgi:hypothetical protein
MKERSLNVYENKGPLWKTGGQAGMYMKKSYLATLYLYYIENKPVTVWKGWWQAR